MADYIDRENLYEKIKNVYIASLQLLDNSSSAYTSCLYVIKNAPTIDAVEVVRCKDCKHRDKLNNACLYPFIKDEEDNLYHKIVEDTDYCKWGEKE